ncbi:MAG: hypothetical protein ACFE9Z_06875 [Promethearchaeota archaeon]
MTEKDYQTENDFEKYLEDSIREDLDWMEREFVLQFRYKTIKTKQELDMGNKIIDHLIDNIKSNNNENALNLLAITLNRIEQEFPEFF